LNWTKINVKTKRRIRRWQSKLLDEFLEEKENPEKESKEQCSTITVKNENNFPSEFWALFDHILWLESQTQKSKRTTTSFSIKGQKISRKVGHLLVDNQKVQINVLFGQKVGQISTYPIAWNKSWLETHLDFYSNIFCQSYTNFRRLFRRLARSSNGVTVLQSSTLLPNYKNQGWT